MFNMLKITMLGGDTEISSIYEHVAVHRQMLVVGVDVEQYGAKTLPCGSPFF